MKFFIDTANLDQIKEAEDMGILDGVTTNPSLMAKEGISGEENIINHYKNICEIVDGDVSAEVISTDFEGMIKEGEKLAALHPNIVVKVPMITEGIKAIKYLIDRGFWVLRIGDPPTKKVKFKNKKFIDYPYSKIKSEQMDLYLIQRSSFYIGTQSGPIEVAYMFRKPALFINMVQALECLPKMKNDRGIFKKIINKKTKKVIPIRKYINFPFRYHDGGIIIKDHEFIENTPEEIYFAVKEFSHNLNGKNKLINTSLQIKFGRLLKKRFSNFFYENDKNEISLLKCGDPDRLERIRIFKNFEGSFCNSYLKKNF